MGDALDGACTAGIFAVDERQESVAQGKLNGDLAFTPHEYVRTYTYACIIRRSQEDAGSVTVLSTILSHQCGPKVHEAFFLKLLHTLNRS